MEDFLTDNKVIKLQIVPLTKYYKNYFNLFKNTQALGLMYFPPSGSGRKIGLVRAYSGNLVLDSCYICGTQIFYNLPE